MEERYEPLKELDSGNFGVARLVRDKVTKDIVAAKYIERGINFGVKEEALQRWRMKKIGVNIDGSETKSLEIASWGYVAASGDVKRRERWPEELCRDGRKMLMVDTTLDALGVKLVDPSSVPSSSIALADLIPVS
ncbi:hypothetical protein K1719_027487 [Acacia pycnantha]|nr:hypothetical protein K1719_027487 [Acacia pycnantha]